jgi:hypothetical protein
MHRVPQKRENPMAKRNSLNALEHTVTNIKQVFHLIFEHTGKKETHKFYVRLNRWSSHSEIHAGLPISERKGQNDF